LTLVSSAAEAPRSSTVQPSGSAQPSKYISVLGGAGVADTGVGRAQPGRGPEAAARAAVVSAGPSVAGAAASAALDAAEVLSGAAPAGCGRSSTLNLLQLPTNTDDSSSTELATCSSRIHTPTKCTTVGARQDTCFALASAHTNVQHKQQHVQHAPDKQLHTRTSSLQTSCYRSGRIATMSLSPPKPCAALACIHQRMHRLILRPTLTPMQRASRSSSSGLV
jgi:hypothetical protein